MAAPHRCEGVEAGGPVAERRLLVEVSVEQGGAGAVGGRGWEVNHDGRRPPLEALHRHAGSGDPARLGPADEEGDRLLDGGLPGARWGEVRREALDGQVVLEQADQLGVDGRAESGGEAIHPSTLPGEHPAVLPAHVDGPPAAPGHARTPGSQVVGGVLHR